MNPSVRPRSTLPLGDASSAASTCAFFSWSMSRSSALAAASSSVRTVALPRLWISQIRPRRERVSSSSLRVETLARAAAASTPAAASRSGCCPWGGGGAYSGSRVAGLGVPHSSNSFWAAVLRAVSSAGVEPAAAVTRSAASARTRAARANSRSTMWRSRPCIPASSSRSRSVSASASRWARRTAARSLARTSRSADSASTTRQSCLSGRAGSRWAGKRWRILSGRVLIPPPGGPRCGSRALPAR